jgi:alpha-N-arabinofuranosidase
MLSQRVARREVFRAVCAVAAILPALATGAEPPKPAGANLLVNAGLEQFDVAGGLPQSFGKVVYGAPPTIAPDTRVFVQGRQSMRIDAKRPSDTAVAQDVLVRPGGIYRFSGRVKTRNLVPEPSSWTYGTYQIQTPGGHTIARLRNHRDTTEWTEESVVFRAPADGKLHIVCFHVGFGKGTGTAWFDDLRLVELADGGSLTVMAEPLQREPISPLIYGNFVELLSDLVPSMWAEKLDVTSFEFLRTPDQRKLRESRFTFDRTRDPKDRHWRPLGEAGFAKISVDPDDPFNGELSMRIDLAAPAPSSAPTGAPPPRSPDASDRSVQAGIAQDGIAVRRGLACRFVGHFRASGSVRQVRVELVRGGDVIAGALVDGLGPRWKRHEVRLVPNATIADASFTLRIDAPGTLWVDRVSLVPEDNVGGWRRDVVEAIRAMKPGVIRWGGSIVEGYDWKCGIGPWERRVPFANRYWGRVDPNLVGIDEFASFCRAVGAEALICVRWSGTTPRDAAEQVEYCNGGPDTPMGALRARNGHPEPYRVKFWQVGNEVSGPQYDATAADFARAMKKTDPSIRVLASYISEPLLRSAGAWIDAVSPHHYDCANLEATAASFDQYEDLLRRIAPGRGITLSVTEWNTTAGGWELGRRHLWTLENGIACARYWNFCQRRSDSIGIACRSNISNSYCSGIIQTNNHAWYGTPAYHVSKLYAEHAGVRPLRLGEAAMLLPVDVSANLSADGRTLSLAAVNPTKEPVEVSVDLSAFRGVGGRAETWTIGDADDARDPDAVNSFGRPERIAARGAEFAGAGRRFSYRFGALSITVLKISVEK